MQRRRDHQLRVRPIRYRQRRALQGVIVLIHWLSVRKALDATPQQLDNLVRRQSASSMPGAPLRHTSRVLPSSYTSGGSNHNRKETSATEVTPPKAIVTRFNACINARDADGLAELMTDDHVFIDSLEASVHGRPDASRPGAVFSSSFPTTPTRSRN